MEMSRHTRARKGNDRWRRRRHRGWKDEEEIVYKEAPPRNLLSPLLFTIISLKPAQSTAAHTLSTTLLLTCQSRAGRSFQDFHDEVLTRPPDTGGLPGSRHFHLPSAADPQDPRCYGAPVRHCSAAPHSAGSPASAGQPSVHGQRYQAQEDWILLDRCR